MRTKSPWRQRVALVAVSFGAGLIIGAVSTSSANQTAPQAGARAGVATVNEALWSREAQRVVETPSSALPRVQGAAITPALQPAPQAPPRSTQTAPLRLFGIEVIDAGSFRMGTSEYVLADVRAPGAQELCTDQRPGRWRCGSRARDVLARIVEGRSLDCINRGSSDGRVAVSCRIDGVDIAAWMAGEGWVIPVEQAPGPLRLAHEKAVAAGLGQFAQDFRTTRRQEAESKLPASSVSDQRPAAR
jgi:endonuclease YncB( thermonuclease family)